MPARIENDRNHSRDIHWRVEGPDLSRTSRGIEAVRNHLARAFPIPENDSGGAPAGQRLPTTWRFVVGLQIFQIIIASLKRIGRIRRRRGIAQLPDDFPGAGLQNLRGIFEWHEAMNLELIRAQPEDEQPDGNDPDQYQCN